MFVFTVFTGIMVVCAAMIGVADIIRDLILDNQMISAYMEYDYLVDLALTGPCKIPPEMFFLGLDSKEFMVEVEDEVSQILYFGYNPQDLQRILDAAEVLSDEGSSPLIIDIRGPMINEIRDEFRAKNFDQRGKPVTLENYGYSAY